MVYRKYSTRDRIEWQIQHEAKASAVFDTRPHSKYCIFHKSWVDGAVTDLLFYIGGG